MNIWSESYLKEWLNPVVIEHWLPGHTVLVIEKSPKSFVEFGKQSEVIVTM